MTRWAARDHEVGLAAFLIPHRRERFLTSLAAGHPRRQKATGRLAHFPDLDPAFCHPVDSSGRAAENVHRTLTQLREAGAPELAYVVADDNALDGQTLDVADALVRILATGTGALVSCIPGQLALFEGEHPGDRNVLIRSNR